MTEALSLATALRATEILLALAFLQSSAEHIFGSRIEAPMFLTRGLLSLALLAGVASPWVLLGLTLHSLWMLHRFQGPYNGGSDRMGLLILYCLTAAQWAPPGLPQDLAMGYLAVQVVLSYYMSGQVKLMNPDWRSGRALREVFDFSAYPISQDLRSLSQRPRLLAAASWGVMVFEVLFPLSLLARPALIGALAGAALFHAANACLFGLNRFLWVWIAGYPALIWVQGRLFAHLWG